MNENQNVVYKLLNQNLKPKIFFYLDVDIKSTKKGITSFWKFYEWGNYNFKIGFSMPQIIPKLDYDLKVVSQPLCFMRRSVAL